MKTEKLHTSTLEKLFGVVQNDIIRQDKNLRIVHIRDKNRVSRTLAIVRFFEIDGVILKLAHKKILSGNLLGKTLCEFNIDFNKKAIGSLDFKLPIWLKKEFQTAHDSGLILYSKILIFDNYKFDKESVYAEIIEIIPSEIKTYFKSKINPISVIDENLNYLLDAIKITESNK